jgi:hypothetical protein
MGIKSFFFGGGGPKYSDASKQTGVGSIWGLGNRAGAKYTGDVKGLPHYDYSQSFKPVGMQDATKGYDFKPMDEAIKGFRKPSLFKEAYNPFQFNYNDPTTLNQYADNQYALGSKDIRREGQGQLTQAKEAIGVRRPGLLMKAAEANNRNTGEQLARLNSELRGGVLSKQIDLNKAMQEGQAGEGYKGYQSRADLEKLGADERFRNLGALADTGQSKIGTQAGLTESERAYQDKALQYLMEMAMQLKNQDIGLAPKGGGLFGTIAKVGGDVAKAYAGGG